MDRQPKRARFESQEAPQTASLQPRAEHIYYDVVMPAQYTAPNYPNGTAAEQDQRNSPILLQPSDYELSILRLTIPGGTIPLKIMEMLFNPATPANINNTIYSVQMVGPANTSLERYVQWVTQDSTARFPDTLVAGQTVYPDYADYYSLRSLDLWCTMLNTALALAFADLTGKTSVVAPFFAFDGATELFTLYMQSTSISTDNIRIFFNVPLANMFGSTLPLRRLSPAPSGNVGYQLASALSIVNIVTLGTGPPRDYITFKQSYSNVNTSDFMSLASILVTSDLATRLQFEPSATNYSANQSSVNQQRNILTNFGITNGNVRQDITYVPTAEYRRMEMLSSSPMYGGSMAVLWQDTLGNLYPIRVPAGKAANMLLLFERIQSK